MATVAGGTNVTYEALVELTSINCGKCGGTYAINERYRAKCKEVGTGWHCPYCECTWGYFKDNDNARLKRELEQKNNQLVAKQAILDQTRAELRETESRRRAEKGAKTRIKNRVGKGVCPCCNRYFEALDRHMKSKHADYLSKESAE